MKRNRFFILVCFAIVLLVMTACTSMPKLDLSTLDPSQPVQVCGIFLYIYDQTNDEAFYGKYGTGLRNPSATLDAADADKLLEILCGNVSENWESITNYIKTETGLTLDGDRFMQDLDFNDSTRIVSQQLTGMVKGYFYTWNVMDIEFPVVHIGIMADSQTGDIMLNKAIFEIGDIDAYGTITNKRQSEISFAEFKGGNWQYKPGFIR